MRTTPAGLHSAALVAFDGKVRACLESIGCFPVPDRIWHQATLGVKHGGLGLRQCAVHATAAYLASVATTQEACRGLDGRYNPDWPTSSATAATYNAVVHLDWGVCHGGNVHAILHLQPMVVQGLACIHG